MHNLFEEEKDVVNEIGYKTLPMIKEEAERESISSKSKSIRMG